MDEISLFTVIRPADSVFDDADHEAARKRLLAAVAEEYAAEEDGTQYAAARSHGHPQPPRRVPARLTRTSAQQRGRRRVALGAAIATAAAAAVLGLVVSGMKGSADSSPTPTAVRRTPSVLPRPGSPSSAAELVAYSTRAAAAEPAFDPQPYQWVYTDIVMAASSTGSGKYQNGLPGHTQTSQTWTRVDGRQYAYLKNGKLTIMPVNTSAGSRAVPMPLPIGWPSISYPYLDSLPTSPAQLTSVIKDNLKVSGSNDNGSDVFSTVEALMENVVLPPRLLAGLYGVLAADPDVRFDSSVKDLAGRTGVAFSTVQQGYVKNEIVVNPATYAYMGDLSVAVRAHADVSLDGTTHFHKGQILGWQAVLRTGIVQRPGQIP